jgi:hypothetical protein
MKRAKDPATRAAGTPAPRFTAAPVELAAATAEVVEEARDRGVELAVTDIVTMLELGVGVGVGVTELTRMRVLVMVVVAVDVTSSSAKANGAAARQRREVMTVVNFIVGSNAQQ